MNFSNKKNVWHFSTGLNVGDDTTQIQAYAACSAAAVGDIERLQQMLKHGVDIHQSDYDHRTSLHLSCERGQIVIVKYLITVGAPLELKDNFGNTPLSLALDNENFDIAFIIENAISSQEKRKLEIEYNKDQYIQDILPPLERKSISENSNIETKYNRVILENQNSQEIDDSPIIKKINLQRVVHQKYLLRLKALLEK